MRLDLRDGDLVCPFCSHRWPVNDQTTLGEILRMVREHVEREHPV